MFHRRRILIGKLAAFILTRPCALLFAIHPRPAPLPPPPSSRQSFLTRSRIASSSSSSSVASGTKLARIDGRSREIRDSKAPNLANEELSYIACLWFTDYLDLAARAYIRTYIHAYIHTYIHTYIYIYTHTHISAMRATRGVESRPVGGSS